VRNINRVVLILVLLFLTACQWSRVADYDPQVDLLLVESKVKIDAHWQRMLQLPQHERKFDRFKAGYLDINHDLNVLEELNNRRSDNQDSITQTKSAVTLWRQDMRRHEQEGYLSDFAIKRRQNAYRRLLNALLAAEKTKPKAN